MYWLISQLDYGVRLNWTLLPANSLSVLINQTLQASTAGQVLRIPILLGLTNATATTCINWAGPSTDPGSSPASINLSFFYIVCKFFVATEAAVSSDNTLFPPSSPDLDTAPLWCPYADQDWVTPDMHASNAKWEEKLNITDAVLDKTTRLVITNGGLDRTAAIGTPILSRTTSDRNQSRVITAEGIGHAENSFSESVLPRGIRPQVDQVSVP
jgi:hypothetical protein